MPQVDQEDYVAAVRRFSRFYTRRIGLLHEGLLGGPLSLAEGRLVYELAQRKTSTAKELGAELELDSGYLSRLLRGLEERGLVSKSPSLEDGRQVLISLTPAGRESFATIDARSRDEVSAMLDRLSLPERRKLATALAEAERLLAGPTPEPTRVPYILRTHQPGDMGWIVHRHGVLYSEEYGWDERFEALVARITADFIQNFKPNRERCWVAEREGEIVGSVFLVEESATVGKLRLLYTEPSARGLGIGRRLVEECIRFARQAGYSKVTLWTNDILTAARHIYQTTGFHLVHEEKHHSFGHNLVGQNWELML
ncbi:helix-turn-helix domain-containing GNAT family N-acetyltransferase [Sinorhizobium garamanticum]|uniref:Helix-turn-helix domain-containing GNAT family N-acetyltransferase n=1 Tax=Sinorhizobium garamanticum TaxID=680247 RepID=A0ABY8D551_9HYPH|nr:helix-turn-helix domain-containing GNAT family N-acetyltransferase [Sinorhizobium garamanticum]WEX85985.1 helix-turn-helix domain-containing GNAT family N-acetyltransferase [Sinorhizobium garamanticum]